MRHREPTEPHPRSVRQEFGTNRLTTRSQQSSTRAMLGGNLSTNTSPEQRTQRHPTNLTRSNLENKTKNTHQEPQYTGICFLRFLVTSA